MECAEENLKSCSECEMRKICVLSPLRKVAKKPPLGVIPKTQWLWLRYCDLLEAITRYASEGIIASPEWIDEMKSIQSQLEGTEYGKSTN